MIGDDDQLFTILLLVAVGFLIHHLTKPRTKKGTKKAERFETFAQAKSAASPAASPKASPAASPKASPAASPRASPAVSPKASPAASPKASPAASPKADSDNNLFSFGSNDIESSGADLQTAFQRPIPQGANSSAVDLNKNNGKKYEAKDFLPKEINKQWFDPDFSQAKVNVNDDKLINTERYVIGINTVGQSLKNASHDIRGTIANPKFTISPWNNSTYEPDTNLKSLC